MVRLAAHDAGLDQGGGPLVEKDKRVLFVAANLTTHGLDRFGPLYEWLDRHATTVAKMLMKEHYRHIETLTGDELTKDAFLNRLVELAEDPQTLAVDVVLSLHGWPQDLYFHDGSYLVASLCEELKAKKLKHRLRLLYSTACFGANHAPHFVEAGFRVASGAKATNANGPYDYPTQLDGWRRGKTYWSTVKRANNPIFIAMHDAIARELMGFDDANSFKEIAGRVYTHIYTPAD